MGTGHASPRRMSSSGGPVAVKVLADHLTPTISRRGGAFSARRGRRRGAVPHPAVVTIFDVGDTRPLCPSPCSRSWARPFTDGAHVRCTLATPSSARSIPRRRPRAGSRGRRGARRRPRRRRRPPRHQAGEPAARRARPPRASATSGSPRLRPPTTSSSPRPARCSAPPPTSRPSRPSATAPPPLGPLRARRRRLRAADRHATFRAENFAAQARAHIEDPPAAVRAATRGCRPRSTPCCAAGWPRIRTTAGRPRRDGRDALDDALDAPPTEATRAMRPDARRASHSAAAPAALGAPPPSRRRRFGGAALLAGLAGLLLVAVAAAVLLSGGGNDPEPSTAAKPAPTKTADAAPRRRRRPRRRRPRRRRRRRPPRRPPRPRPRRRRASTRRRRPRQAAQLQTAASAPATRATSTRTCDLTAGAQGLAATPSG